MLKNIFTKTLFEKRWSTLIWLAAIALFSLFVVAMFPTFRESFGEALKDTPESLKSLLGEASDYQNINGYIDIQVINQMVFLTLIMGIILGTALLGGEENDGRLQTLLAQPVSRTKVYWHKFIAMSLILFIGTAGVFAGTMLGALMVGEAGNIDMARLALATLMTWLVTMVFTVLAFAIGAITGKKGMSGIVAGFLAFATFMITTLAGTATVLKSVNHFSPFKYFNTPSIMKTGLDTGNLFILLAIIAILALAGWFWFVRRDVYQK
jgi:ABC-2 type transport system permease protein